MPTDYARMVYQNAAHHARYVRHVKAMPRKLVCQDCGGEGGHVEPVLDYGEGPWEPCGWCEGTGYVTPYTRMLWLQCKRQEKRRLRASQE